LQAGAAPGSSGISQPTAERMPRPSAQHRRALELLAGSPAGLTDSLLLAHGITRTLLAELVLDGLATADTERMQAGVRSVDVRRFKITEAGRVALER
jgi:hypothetical protein